MPVLCRENRPLFSHAGVSRSLRKTIAENEPVATARHGEDALRVPADIALPGADDCACAHKRCEVMALVEAMLPALVT